MAGGGGKETDMMRNILIHIKIIIRKKEHILGVALVFLYVFFALAYNMYGTHGRDIQDMYAPYEYDALSEWNSFYMYYKELFPFLIVLFSGFSFFWDMDSGEMALLQCRMGRKQYYRSRLAATGIVGALSFIIPFSMGLFLDWLTFPPTEGIPSNFPMFSPAYECFGEEISSWYFVHPWLYHFLAILQIGIFTGVVSMAISLFSFLRFRFRILYFLPLYCVCMATSLIEVFGIGSAIYILSYVGTENGISGKIPFYLLVLCIPLGLFVLGMLRYVEREEVVQG